MLGNNRPDNLYAVVMKEMTGTSARFTCAWMRHGVYGGQPSGP